MFFDHSHLKMQWINHHQIYQKDGYLNYYPPPSTTPSTSSPTSSSSSGTRISPAVLFIIVILAVVFFISGILHLLVRFLIKNPSSQASNRNQQHHHHHEISTSDAALQRQLQQLFHLHDSGLDQAFIDALPVFHYKEIVGPKEPFDCAVCLCEFSDKDKLRLLPMCSHAFHISCIDTWLLSNSTCPLCRGTLLTPGFSIENPMFDFDDLREDDEGNVENGFSSSANKEKKVMVEESVVVGKGVFPIRLGKFKKVNLEEGEESSVVGETSSSNLDARRCYSMGSYQYVVGNSELRVSLNHDQRCRDSKIGFKGHEQEIEKVSVEGEMEEEEEGKRIRSVSKGESFSVSKIWLWPKKGKFSTSSEAPQMGMPTFLNTDLPRMRGNRTTEGV